MLQDSSLTHLNLSRNNLGIEGLQMLEPALMYYKSNLVYLNISDCQIDHKGFLYFADLMKSNLSIKSFVCDKNYINDSRIFLALKTMIS